MLAAVGVALHQLSPRGISSPRGAPPLAMEPARAELTRLGHGGGPDGARRLAMEAARADLALHRPSPAPASTPTLPASDLQSAGLQSASPPWKEVEKGCVRSGQNGKFSYGYASSPGKRASMEDFYETKIDSVDGQIIGLFGVFDGHGGAKVAEYVKENLFSNLLRHPKFISDTKVAIDDAYKSTDSEFLESDSSQNQCGSTASTAVLVGDRLFVANVGDSRAIICRGGNAIAVSKDHKPDQTDERQRIEDAGGFVMWAGTWRVGGVLAVSRAFGDKLLKQYVVVDPEIREEVVDDTLEFLILASDGLWDVVSNEEAVAMTRSIRDPEEAAKKLLHEAYKRESSDNITCVVVRFLQGQGSSGYA